MKQPPRPPPPPPPLPRSTRRTSQPVASQPGPGGAGDGRNGQHVQLLADASDFAATLWHNLSNSETMQSVAASETVAAATETIKNAATTTAAASASYFGGGGQPDPEAHNSASGAAHSTDHAVSGSSERIHAGDQHYTPSFGGDVGRASSRDYARHLHRRVAGSDENVARSGRTTSTSSGDDDGEVVVPPRTGTTTSASGPGAGAASSNSSFPIGRLKSSYKKAKKQFKHFERHYVPDLYPVVEKVWTSMWTGSTGSSASASNPMLPGAGRKKKKREVEIELETTGTSGTGTAPSITTKSQRSVQAQGSLRDEKKRSGAYPPTTMKTSPSAPATASASAPTPSSRTTAPTTFVQFQLQDRLRHSAVFGTKKETGVTETTRRPHLPPHDGKHPHLQEFADLGAAPGAGPVMQMDNFRGFTVPAFEDGKDKQLKAFAHYRNYNKSHDFASRSSKGSSLLGFEDEENDKDDEGGEQEHAVALFSRTSKGSSMTSRSRDEEVADHHGRSASSVFHPPGAGAPAAVVEHYRIGSSSSSSSGVIGSGSAPGRAGVRDSVRKKTSGGPKNFYMGDDLSEWLEKN